MYQPIMCCVIVFHRQMMLNGFKEQILFTSKYYHILLSFTCDMFTYGTQISTKLHVIRFVTGKDTSSKYLLIIILALLIKVTKS